MKLSFKKQPKETGLRSVGNPYPYVEIKGDKKKVGWIHPKSWQVDQYSVWFYVKDGSGFKNVQLTFRCDTEQEAREFIKAKWARIQEKFDLYQLED